MTYQSSSITVDDREPNAVKTRDAFRKRHISAQVSRLLLGDLRWTVTDTTANTMVEFIVERKTTQDLVNSLQDGRLGKFVDYEPSSNEVRLLLHERTDRK